MTLPFSSASGDTNDRGSARRARRNNWRSIGPSPLSIEQVPLPLPGNDRAAWRVAALVLCLAGCRGQSASVEQLHVLAWALRGEENAKRLLNVWNGEPGAPSILRVWDNSLDDTLKLANAAGLVDAQTNGRRKLTSRGKNLVAAIRGDAEELMRDEQAFLASLGLISETAMWRRLGTPPRPPKSGEGSVR
jgi:hypothetical protein